MAASGAALILSSGAKGKRFALPNSRIMVHQPLGGAQGQVTDIEIQTRELKRIKDTINKILTQPKNAIVKQYKKIFELEGVKLNLTSEALNAIVEESIKRKIGARGLRSIMEDSILDIMYQIPSEKNIEKCTITEEVVKKRQMPEIERYRGNIRKETA